MKVLVVKNNQEGLSKALSLLYKEGEQRNSRNGPVLTTPYPVTTVFEKPLERIIFNPERDYNCAFILYEAMWMLAGRNDVAPIARYAKNMMNYSVDKTNLHAAYGHRWRKQFGIDQLEIIAQRLQNNKEDRRSVLQMWDSRLDLHRDDKALDLPCNDTCTFQIGADGKLYLVVFCRSNDVVWGTFFANQGHFSTLLEYMSLYIGVPIGTYTQISVNFHGYLNVLDTVKELQYADFKNPYEHGISTLPMTESRHGESPNDTIKRLDKSIKELLLHADTNFKLPRLENDNETWVDVAYAVLKAHELWRTLAAPERFEEPLKVLAAQPKNVDWIVAMREWIERRQAIWEQKQIAGGKIQE